MPKRFQAYCSSMHDGTKPEARDPERITINPKQCGGRPCVRGMRIRVKDVLDMLAEGASEQEILQDYPDLEADSCVDSLAGRPAVGYDIRFFSFDLTNTCWIRSFYSSRGTMVVMCQVNDLELETNEPVLRAICASLEVDDE